MADHLRRLLDPILLILVALFAVGLRLALAAGLFGIPLALILVSWLFKYAYVLLEDVAHGIRKPRVMSIEMVNPVEQRPLAQLAICTAAVLAVRAIGGTSSAVVGVVLVALLPASVAILGASGSALQAINPAALVRVITTLGRDYLVVLAALALISLGAWGLLAIGPPLTLQFAYLIFAVLATFNLIGAMLYQHREALDLPTVQSPEQSRERDQNERARERDRLIDELYVLTRARKYTDLDAPLDRWLTRIPPAQLDDDGRTLVSAARSWADTRASSVIARAVIRRLRAVRRELGALDAFESALAGDPHFHLAQCLDAIELAELAIAAGRRPLARRILATCTAGQPNEYESKRLARLQQALER